MINAILPRIMICGFSRKSYCNFCDGFNGFNGFFWRIDVNGNSTKIVARQYTTNMTNIPMHAIT
jgi:hypothetical protein